MKISATLPAWALPMFLGSHAITPFVDGNKRAAFAALGVFLGKNGWRLVADQTDAANTILAAAAGQLGDDSLTQASGEGGNQRRSMKV
jgi:prophage maintenance system killer protein